VKISSYLISVELVYYKKRNALRTEVHRALCLGALRALFQQGKIFDLPVVLPLGLFVGQIGLAV